MRRKQLLGALLALLLLLGLPGCGKKTGESGAAPELPRETAIPAGDDLSAANGMARELSSTQMQLITDSIEIISGECESGGVKIRLLSAMGDGCFNCFSLLIELPRGSAPGAEGYGFERAEILFGDEQAAFITTAAESTVTPDDNPRDDAYSLRLSVGTSRWDNKDYTLNNDKTRTLRLENIVSDDGAVLFKGVWSFDFVFAITGEYTELVKEPIKVLGVSPTGHYGEETWAEISSFVLSNFSAECRYRLTNGQASEPVSYGLSYVEMKTGEKHLIGCANSRIDGDFEIRDYYMAIPIAPEEVRRIHLSDRIELEVG